MVKRYLNYYGKILVSLEEKIIKMEFVPVNGISPDMKFYLQSLKTSDGYLYANFSKKNLFLTLTDNLGNCIRSHFLVVLKD